MERIVGNFDTLDLFKFETISLLQKIVSSDGTMTSQETGVFSYYDSIMSLEGFLISAMFVKNNDRHQRYFQRKFDK
jgi:hypothetical protein